MVCNIMSTFDFRPCCLDIMLQVAQGFLMNEDAGKKGNTKMKRTSTTKRKPRKLRSRRRLDFKAITRGNIKRMKSELQLFDSAVGYLNNMRQNLRKNIRTEEKYLCQPSIMVTSVHRKPSKS